MIYLIIPFYYLIVLVGFIQQSIFGSTNVYSYVAFRKLFAYSNGASNNFFSKTISSFSKKYPQIDEPIKGILGEFSHSEIKKISSEIEENGFYVFDKLLPEEICDRIIEFANSTKAETVPKKKNHEYIHFDQNEIHAPMYKYREADLLQSKEIRKIITDDVIFSIAQEYLNTKPINDIHVMWWSAPFSKNASSEAAQMYHFDMDHFKFIKFFIYLSDVNDENGPHCYIKGSNKSLPKPLREARRYSDEEISTNFDKSQVTEITGKKGTIFIADTKGIHKGKVVEKGSRLMFQIEFTNHFFGQKVENLSSHIHNFDELELKKIKAKKHSFQRFF